jgi:hypothetical protein
MASEQAAWASSIRHGEGQVRVGVHQFDVTARACENPECTCEELTLRFREQSPRAKCAAIAFDVVMDLASASPPTTKGLGREAERLAARMAEDRGPVRATLRSVPGTTR